MYGIKEGTAGVSSNLSGQPGIPPPISSNGQQGYYPGYSDYTTYGNTNYQGYTYATHHHQPQSNIHPSYSQNTGAYESSVAPYIPPPAPYPSTNLTNPYQQQGGTAAYQNTGTTYQSNGGYQAPSMNYDGSTATWSGNNNLNYNAYTSSYPSYGGYAPAPAPAPTPVPVPPQPSGGGASVTVGHSLYSQDYQQQWGGYYGSYQSGGQQEGNFEVSCAPGMETAAALDSQPPPPGMQTAWQDFPPLPMAQVPATSAVSGGGSWETCGVASFQNDQSNQKMQQSSHFEGQSYSQQSLLEQPLQFQPNNSQDQHLSLLHQQGQHLPNLSNHIPSGSFQPKPPQPKNTEASQKRMTKLQIPTNPRIATTSGGLGSVNSSKVNSMDAVQSQKPAYVSVMKTSNAKTPSVDASADSMVQPSSFPPSLRAYVERALSRCKDDTQKAICRDVMKEMITKASREGCLFTKNWDTEPMFPLPSATSSANVKDSSVSTSLFKVHQSPVKRSKSRWEPVPEGKPDEKRDYMQVHETTKDVPWDKLKGEPVKQDNAMNKSKLILQQHLFNSQQPERVFKKSRIEASSGNLEVERDNSSAESEEESIDPGGVHLGTLSNAETPEEKRKRQIRTKRFDIGKVSSGGGYKPALRNMKSIRGNANNVKRANALLPAKGGYGDGNAGAVEDIDWDSLTVRGTCQEIEKKYLRLTSAPDPSTVRPEEILRRALQMVLRTSKNYLYKCEQLKSIRQDLTVQRIRNELTVQVYETHGRMALEAGDLSEYNQCQSQLKGLYAEGIKGRFHEFVAYNLLYVALNEPNNMDLLASMSRLSNDAKTDEAVAHALSVRAAAASGNYTSFFRLYTKAPNLNACLMDMYAEKMRFDAVRCMARSYRPTLPVAYIARTLGFLCGGSDLQWDAESDAIEECEEWLKAHGAHITVEITTHEVQLDCKASASTLFMPEPEDAVPHGDANLAVNDFFAQASG